VRIAISAGHGSRIRGASDIIDEVDEARRVCTRVCQLLDEMDVHVLGPYFDDVSISQGENLDRICDWHNSHGSGEDRIDLSCHFNAYEHTSNCRGCEVWYYSQHDMADDLSAAIAEGGDFIDRGPKHSTELTFLRETTGKSVLLEICFVDSECDVSRYRQGFEEICSCLADKLAEYCGQAPPVRPPRPERPLPPDVDDEPLFYARGTCSTFGGPDDTGVAEDEGLAFIYDIDEAPHLFLPEPPESVGLARSLDAERAYYIACRWNYEVTPKGLLADPRYKAAVTNLQKGITIYAYPADWGPHESTGRVADLSPALAKALGVATDDVVEVRYPA